MALSWSDIAPPSHNLHKTGSGLLLLALPCSQRLLRHALVLLSQQTRALSGPSRHPSTGNSECLPDIIISLHAFASIVLLDQDVMLESEAPESPLSRCTLPCWFLRWICRKLMYFQLTTARISPITLGVSDPDRPTIASDRSDAIPGPVNLSSSRYWRRQVCFDRLYTSYNCLTITVCIVLRGT